MSKRVKARLSTTTVGEAAKTIRPIQVYCGKIIDSLGQAREYSLNTLSPNRKKELNGLGYYKVLFSATYDIYHAYEYSYEINNILYHDTEGNNKIKNTDLLTIERLATVNELFKIITQHAKSVQTSLLVINLALHNLSVNEHLREQISSAYDYSKCLVNYLEIATVLNDKDLDLVNKLAKNKELRNSINQIVASIDNKLEWLRNQHEEYLKETQEPITNLESMSYSEPNNA